VLPFSFTTSMPFTIRNDFSINPILQNDFDIKIKNIFYNKEVGIKVSFTQDNIDGIYWEGISEQNIKL